MADCGQWVAICSSAEFVGKRMLKCMAEGIEVLLCRVGTDMIAIHNHCTHLGQPLEEGRMIGGQIFCPFHGACFDLRSGKAVSGPAVAPLHAFPVRTTGGQIWLDMTNKPRYMRFA